MNVAIYKNYVKEIYDYLVMLKMFCDFEIISK